MTCFEISEQSVKNFIKILNLKNISYKFYMRNRQEYYQKNKEEIKRKSNEYYRKNREQILQKHHTIYKINRIENLNNIKPQNININNQFNINKNLVVLSFN
jgi:hypothetical protein